MLHVVSALWAALDLHTHEPRPQELTCRRQFAVQ